MVQQTQTPQPIVIKVKTHGLIIRALYFCFIGWWFGLFWALLSWVMYATVVFAPLGVVMLNKVPGAISLKARERNMRVITDESGYTAKLENAEQFPLWVRVIYYPFGLAFSLAAIFLGWFLCVALITLPLGILVFNRVPAIASLHRR
ncbi:MAG: hypothetical protein PHP28_05435 [Actinomycetota bacterium]|nr:hypothetical protein [Actinomycetota bacterium]MDD5666971.1 hypothetical protein [Actinomycetota bacterium]